jgi:uncharacterized protein (DUF427 family)
VATASWNGKIVAKTNKAILVEGNLYFPPESLEVKYFKKSAKEYVCPWKGIAGYYDIKVDGEINKDAAWYYYTTKKAAKSIENYVAFDRTLGIKVEGTSIDTIETPSRNG